MRIFSILILNTWEEVVKKGKSAKGAQGYSKLPAEIPQDLYQKSEQTALAVYRCLGCSGIARVDLLIDTKTKKSIF